jgi:integrase
LGFEEPVELAGDVADQAASDLAVGLPRIRLHDVRHSYATAALKAGISAR